MKVEKLRTELKQRKDKDVSLTSRIEDLMEVGSIGMIKLTVNSLTGS